MKFEKNDLEMRIREIFELEEEGHISRKALEVAAVLEAVDVCGVDYPVAIREISRITGLSYSTIADKCGRQGKRTAAQMRKLCSDSVKNLASNIACENALYEEFRGSRYSYRDTQLIMRVYRDIREVHFACAS